MTAKTATTAPEEQDKGHNFVTKNQKYLLFQRGFEYSMELAGSNHDLFVPADAHRLTCLKCFCNATAVIGAVGGTNRIEPLTRRVPYGALQQTLAPHYVKLVELTGRHHVSYSACVSDKMNLQFVAEKTFDKGHCGFATIPVVNVTVSLKWCYKMSTNWHTTIENRYVQEWMTPKNFR